ncbi:phosphoadenosine phosphosulfate reductase family protein [Aureisphaera sp. CAU 1614]|uniref:Phosphoadenosine phosphosulfate reductase family protein n=1 Tax=Halomarinibacterium sedimenti TaxID=2857106 RepID=A0A9X1FL90_9FLAO|nr:phosphoadenosine phosphosulfate reductase family protein [Halomarinibacterium sedimenti]MBW2936731.1 phosphoadenosine phosphosulfate reductase family protein [Halomarinibacterium sedimenti]
MNQITPQNIHLFNENVRFEDPLEIISFSLEQAKSPLVTTSFGSYSAALLWACSKVKKDIQVIWCDTGYNTEATYKHANYLIENLELNIEIFSPKYTTAYINSRIGLPNINNPNHPIFSEKVKLEPFNRAFKKHQPDVWFTNVRKGQTEHRNGLDVFSFSRDGILKVSPFYHYDDDALEAYIKNKKLPLEFDYFDPVKALENRECGIHLKH